MRFALAVVLALAIGSSALAEQAAPTSQSVVIENDCLKLTISPVGARIVGLYNKVQHREEVKNLPYVGGVNLMRYGAALNIDDMSAIYQLQSKQLADGTWQVIATTQATPTDDKPGAATVTKEYRLAPRTTCVSLTFTMRNDGAEEIGFIPWVQHLLLRGTKEQPEEAHMTEYGAFVTEKPLPEHRDQKIQEGTHYFPASNWISRVVMPVDEHSDTIATVVRPQDMLKIYTWRRPLEDFATQELISAPIFAKPGQTARLDYDVVIAAPVRNIVYCSPDLVIGATPHPTWISAADKELSLDLAATRELANVKVQCKLVTVGQEDKPLSTQEFPIDRLTPDAPAHLKVPVALQDGGRYQLRLSFTQNDQPYFPGAAVEQKSDAIIPLIVGNQPNPGKVFADQTQRDSRLRHLQPQIHKADVALTCDDFDAYSLLSTQRCFLADTFQSRGKEPLKLYACAGEYESAQIVLTPKSKTSITYQISASPLTGSGSSVAVDSVNDFIYVPVRLPSLYNALYRLGDYPEALLPVTQIELKPTGNHPLFITYHVPSDAKPGTYHGSVTLSRNGTKFEIPVEMTVWNIQMPKSTRKMEFASSLKGDVIPGSTQSRQQQRDTICAMHLKYRMTPCDSGIADLLLLGNYKEFEPAMQKLIDGGATKIYLGSVPQIIQSYGQRLPEVEKYLEQKGWTDYFYARPGFDEASPDLIPQIREKCQEWKKVSKIKLMETYYHEDPKGLYGWIDIWSRSIPNSPWMAERRAAGDVFWKVNAMPGTLENEPWDGGRRRYVWIWDYHFTGSYNWTVKAWANVKKWGEDYWCDAGVGNLAAVIMWPHGDGILSTIRLEAMRDGLEDNAMLWMLRDKVEALKGKTLNNPVAIKALDDARAMCSGQPLYSTLKSAEDVQRLHERVGNTLSVLNSMAGSESK